MNSNLPSHSTNPACRYCWCGGEATEQMMQDLILNLKVFGTAGIKTRTLMSGCSIYWQHHIVTNHYLLSTVNKNKKRNVHNYEDRMIQVEHGCFSPLVFTTAGGLSPITNVVYKRLASLISRKQNTSYNKTIFLDQVQVGLCSNSFSYSVSSWFSKFVILLS